MDSKLINAVDSMTDDEKRNLVIHLQNGLLSKTDITPPKVRCLELVTVAELVFGHKLDYDSRLRVDVMIRRFVAYKMRTEGYTLSVIGKSMNKSHAAVLHLINQLDDFFSIPSLYKDEIEKYQEFDKLSKKDGD